MNNITFNPNINFFSSKSQSKNTYNVLRRESENKRSQISPNKLLTFGLMTLAVILAIKNLKSLKNLIIKDKKIAEEVSVKDVFSKVIPPVITPGEKRILSLLKNPLRSMAKKGVYNPQEIDKILTLHVGKAFSKDLKFIANPARGVFEGRKRCYKLSDGNMFVLESHSTPNGLVTRLYKTISNENKLLDKSQRLYLTPEGKFMQDTYYSKLTHLKADDNALSWIRGR